MSAICDGCGRMFVNPNDLTPEGVTGRHLCVQCDEEAEAESICALPSRMAQRAALARTRKGQLREVEQS